MNDAVDPWRELDDVPAGGAGQSRRDDAAWPDPDWSLASDDPLPPPTLPLELFPGAWGGWMLAAAERAGSPVDYVAVSALTAIGAAIGNRRWGSVREEWEHPSVIFGALVGDPSSGKSPAMRSVTSPLGELEETLNEDWKTRQRDHGARVKEAKARRAAWEKEAEEAVKKSYAPPQMPEAALDPDPLDRRRVIVDSVTTERLAAMVKANPAGLLLASDELARWLGGMDRYGNKGGGGSDRAFWLEAHGGGRYTVDRVGKDEVVAIVVRNLTVGVLGGIQPDRLAAALLSGDDDGLAARFLYTWPARVPPRPPEGVSQRAFIAAALGRLVSLPWDGTKPIMLPFHAQAEARMDRFRTEVFEAEGEAAGIMRSWLGKLPGQAVRLAVILAHMEWTAGPDHAPAPTFIAAAHVEAAIALLLKYFWPMARRVFGASALPQDERDARTLARWLLRQRAMPDVLNPRQLRDLKGGPSIPDAARLKAALAVLAEAGWVRPAPARDGDTPGKPRADNAVNPNLRGVRQ